VALILTALPVVSKPVREFVADLFVSLDGFAMGEHSGPFFGYGGPELDAWIADNLDRPQVMVMGRVTYEAMAPRTQDATDAAGARMNALPKIVFSNTLRSPLTWANTRIASGDVVQSMTALKNETGDTLRSIGSMTLVGAVLRAGLVDRLRLMIFPLILGAAGREPISAFFDETHFAAVTTRVLDGRLNLVELQPRPS
jgi:dihydrofolate reductase